MIDKAGLRKQIREKLKEMGGHLRSEYSSAISNTLINTHEFLNSDKIFIYISFDNEVHTQDIINNAFSLGKRVYVPYIQGSDMSMLEIFNDTKYTMNSYGIVEPVFSPENIFNGNVDICVMPLIGFDRTKSRLGRGKGFYDKFLQNRQCIKIAVAFSIQEVDKLPVEPHDMRADIIITEKEVIR